MYKFCNFYTTNWCAYNPSHIKIFFFYYTIQTDNKISQTDRQKKKFQNHHHLVKLLLKEVKKQSN